MRFQDYITTETKTAMDQAFRYAKAVPEDKLNWSPLDKGRTVLDLARELARCSAWTAEMLELGKMPDFTEENQAKEKAVSDTLVTLEDCEKHSNENLEMLYAVFQTIPDERFTDTIFLPFEGGRDFTIQEIMDYPRWNANYHLGQIGYIQILFGDKEMH